MHNSQIEAQGPFCMWSLCERCGRSSRNCLCDFHVIDEQAKRVAEAEAAASDVDDIKDFIQKAADAAHVWEHGTASYEATRGRQTPVIRPGDDGYFSSLISVWLNGIVNNLKEDPCLQKLRKLRIFKG